MNNFLKTATIITFATILNAGNAFAGEYSQKGYIIKAHANIYGSCFLELSNIPNGPNIQAGYWTCNAITGQNMLELARTAKILQSKVTVTYEGDGSVSKPVHAIILDRE